MADDLGGIEETLGFYPVMEDILDKTKETREFHSGMRGNELTDNDSWGYPQGVCFSNVVNSVEGVFDSVLSKVNDDAGKRGLEYVERAASDFDETCGNLPVLFYSLASGDIDRINRKYELAKSKFK